MRVKEDLEVNRLLMQEERYIFTSGREKLRQEAKLHILKVQKDNRRNFNKRSKTSTKHKLGDLVAIKRTQYGTAIKRNP